MAEIGHIPREKRYGYPMRFPFEPIVVGKAVSLCFCLIQDFISCLKCIRS